MENIFLALVVLGAGYFLYKKLFASGGCNCGNGSGGCKTTK
jgi:hypothetical protein